MIGAYQGDGWGESCRSASDEFAVVAEPFA